jgi:hypothetical protein
MVLLYGVTTNIFPYSSMKLYPFTRLCAFQHQDEPSCTMAILSQCERIQVHGSGTLTTSAEKSSTPRVTFPKKSEVPVDGITIRRVPGCIEK